MSDIKEEELTKILETLTTKIDDLTQVLKEGKEVTKEEIKEIEKGDTIMETLTSKVEDLTNVIRDQKEVYENKIKENPLAYVGGALVGGMLLGFLIRRKNGN